MFACQDYPDIAFRLDPEQVQVDEAIASGDITRQGQPFYGGCISYHLSVDIKAGSCEVAASYYRGSLIKVDVDGKDAGIIAFSPYRLQINGLEKGGHNISLKYYGSRINNFGQMHCTGRENAWWGPASWRTCGEAWSYEYEFCSQGILKSPEIYI